MNGRLKRGMELRFFTRRTIVIAVIQISHDSEEGFGIAHEYLPLLPLFSILVLEVGGNLPFHPTLTYS